MKLVIKRWLSRPTPTTATFLIAREVDEDKPERWVVVEGHGKKQAKRERDALKRATKIFVERNWVIFNKQPVIRIPYPKYEPKVPPPPPNEYRFANGTTIRFVGAVRFPWVGSMQMQSDEFMQMQSDEMQGGHHGPNSPPSRSDS